MLKYDLIEFTEKTSVQIYKKDGKARSFFIYKNKIYLRDFCDLYELNCDTLEILRTWKLGENLSSNICAENCGDDKVYACIRGGKIAVIDLENGSFKQYPISDFSMWNIISYGSEIYVGCVNGELIELNKNNMSIKRRKQIHKKNIYSLLIQKDIIYTVSQDSSLIATDVKHLETIFIVKKAISNMSKILGIYDTKLVTSNPNRKEITIWDTKDLTLKQAVSFPTGGLNSNGIVMKDNIIYGSSQDGIYAIDIQEIK